MDKFIPLSVPNFIGNEKKYVDEAVEAGWVSTGGKLITDFENKMKEYTNAKCAVAVQSGTAGLHLALHTLGVDSSQEVIVPTLTFIAAVNPVKYCGAEPVFMDCDDTLCIDPEKVKRFCEEECDFVSGDLINKTTGKKIKVIVVVHVFGNLCDMEKIMPIAEKYNLRVVEDSTEALGGYYLEGKYKDVRAGLVGDIGVYSFNGNKIITTGGGGMIVTNNVELGEKCRFLSTQAKTDSLYFVHDEIGFNYRLTNVQAALGVAQMEKLDEFIKTKQENYKYYNEIGINLIPFRNDIFSNYWFYSYLTSGPEERDEMIKRFGENNIQTRPIWSLIHKQKPYQNSQAYDIEKAIYYQDRIVNLPCSTSLTKEDIDFIKTKFN